MARRTLAEVEEALASVRAAMRKAEEAQEYATGLGNRKLNADLAVLYRRENDLLDERAALQSGSGGGPLWNYGVSNR